MAASYTKAASEAISGLAGSVGGYLGRGIASAGEATGLSGKGGDSSQGGDVPSNSGDQRFAAGFRDAASDAGTGVADG